MKRNVAGAAALAALAIGLGLVTLARSQPPAEAPVKQTFGSQAVLEACWTPAELAGSPEDCLTRRKDPDPHRADPPRRLAPKAGLPPLPADWRGSIRRGGPPPDDKPIALTFDLCERVPNRGGYDAAIVNTLRAQAASATFFAGGKWLRSHPAQAKQLIADPLFEIANHSWSHANFARLTGKQIEEQIQWAQAEYELLREELAQSPCALRAGTAETAKIPPLPLVFRFPYGDCGPVALDAVARHGLASVQWDIVSGDPSPNATGEATAKLVLARARPGSIVVMHANGRGRHTKEALPRIIAGLRDRGYRFVTVSEMLRLGRPMTTAECYENRPGDVRRYDRQK